ncbi:hypothetical protein BDF21DRAFT_58995 [Thamnidium elegans]|nr:hypothetical protein BDF21DRAFT_58995 [Thamnidium elegans]
MSQNIPQTDIPHINFEEQDNELQFVLDALIQLQKEYDAADLDESFEKDYRNIDQAISLNEQLQRKITDHIHLIDKRLELNQKSMTDMRYIANAESRFGQRVYLHRQYDSEISYFDESELIEQKPKDVSSVSEYSPHYEPETVMEEDEEDGVDCENDLPSKAWSRYERNRLVNGIQAEAKRAIAFQFLKK